MHAKEKKKTDEIIDLTARINEQLKKIATLEDKLRKSQALIDNQSDNLDKLRENQTLLTQIAYK